MILIVLFLVIIILKDSLGIIYRLNDSEYDRMPPIYELDKYDSCLKGNDGLYCWAKLELYAEQPNELFTLIQEYSKHNNRHYNHSIIERGICISKRCQNILKDKDINNPEDLKETVDKCAKEILWNEYKLQAKLTRYFCDKPNEKSEKDIFDWVFLSVIFCIIVLNVLGSICDLFQNQDLEKNSNDGLKYYLICFSIFQNWNWLVWFQAEDSRIACLKSLHGIKCVILYLFMIGHSFYLYHAYISNTIEFERIYDYAFYQMMFNGMVSVQPLFVISGFLLVYFLMIESEKRPITWNTVPKVIFLRIWRLSPANAVYVLFCATWLRHVGSGPIWKNFVTNRMSGDCRKYWWSHLLFINNYLSDDRDCVVQNWQLAADTQLFILGVTIFVLTKGRLQTFALFAMVLFGMATMGLHIWLQDLDAFVLLIPEAYREFALIDGAIHKVTHVNIPGFFMGMLAGKLVYNIQKSKISLERFKGIFNFISHSLPIAVAYLFYSGSIFYAEGDRASLELRLYYGMLLRPLMSLITIFGIFVFVFKLNDSWRTFLEWDGWVVPSRLTYSMSLIHTFFIIYMFGTRKQLIELSGFDHTLVHLGITFLSLICAVPYHILIEAPFNNLRKAVINKQVNQVKKKSLKKNYYLFENKNIYLEFCFYFIFYVLHNFNLLISIH